MRFSGEPAAPSLSRRLARPDQQRVRRLEVAFRLRRHGVRKQVRAAAVRDRAQLPDVDEACVLQRLGKMAECQDGQMFPPAEDEIFQAAAEAAPVVRPFREPARVAFDELLDRPVAVGPVDAIDSSGREATERFGEVRLQVRQVLDRMAPIERRRRAVA